MPTASQLGPDEIRVLDVVLAEFFERGDWPTFAVIDRRLDQIDIDAEECLRALAPLYVRGLPRGGAVGPTTKVELSLWALDCLPAAKSLMNDLAAVVHFLAEAERGLEPGDDGHVLVKSDMILEYLTRELFPRDRELLARQLDFVGVLIAQLPGWATISATGSPSWTVSLNREIRRFRAVSSPADLLVAIEDRRPEELGLPVVETETLEEDEMPGTNSSKSVFVVHGRNELARRSMFDFLRSIGLQPIEWSQAVALTGKGSPYIGEVLDAAFDTASAVVVLMTPDEIAYLQPQYGHGETDPETTPSAQARPNVLFEAGMALGRDQDRTILVEVGDVRPFSDVGGRHVVRLTNVVAQRQELARRLQTAGCSVDLSGTDWHTAGDFTPPAPPGGGLSLGRRVPSVPASRKALHFDLRYRELGGNRIDKLTVLNRGAEDAFDVTVSIPDGAALSLLDNPTIARIPSGKSVTLDAYSSLRTMGGPPADSAFDVTVSGSTGDGDVVTQAVFIDINGQ